MHLTRAAVAFPLLVMQAVVYAADWQYAGFAKVEGADTYLFYDVEGVQRPSKDVARYWLKALTRTSLDRYYKEHEKSLIEATAMKIAVGYIPKFYQLEQIKSQYKSMETYRNAIIEIAGYEVIANESDAPARSKLYFELDCRDRKSKVLDMILYTPNGDIAKRFASPQTNYEFIPPDSNGEWQSRLICPKQ